MIEEKLTPMMRQYKEVKEKLQPNTLLLFRLGDFYELFEEDAKAGASILGLTLTNRHGVPMAGLPYHASEKYIHELLRAGKKVAICDQIEPASSGKLVKRCISRILTPGTLLEESHQEVSRNRYLLALTSHRSHLQAAWLDVSTGEFQVTDPTTPENLLPILSSLDAKEIILPEGMREQWARDEKWSAWNEAFDLLASQSTISEVAPFYFDPLIGAQLILDTLEVLNLQGFGLSKDHSGLGPAGALITYTTETLCSKPQNIKKIKRYQSQNTLLLDPSTLRNLEIFKSNAGSREGSLFEAMDNTLTGAGSRLLEQYLSVPILNVEEIYRRQQCVADFYDNPHLTAELRRQLEPIRDVMRILGRLQNRIHNPRELGGIRDTLGQLPQIKSILNRFTSDFIGQLNTRIHALESLFELLKRSLNDTLPTQLQEGGTIRQGYDAELDRLYHLTRDHKTWLAYLEREEQRKTGIKNLKIKYNGAFGYFIEITKSNLNLVPPHYIRKQTMTNAERYCTEELKEKEKEILQAEEKAIAREANLYKEILEKTLNCADLLKETAESLAEVDLFSGWGELARDWNYCRPQLDADDTIMIEQGRHPVVEQMIARSRLGLAGNQSFVPNDTYLSSTQDQIALITGPNMAGKSTFIRQVALITLMAQIGSWVPAKSCRIGLVDRIFSRVGANDELARGNSTFMVEMNETANILNHATEKSLIILDEIGRGTSTYDGLSIAWAVLEYLHAHPNSGPRTLFATHYHELTPLEQKLPRLKNYSIVVKEWNDRIIFVRQVIRGAADRSYGIQVARLAGLPESVIQRAKSILDTLENSNQNHAKIKYRHGNLLDITQLSLF